ncbi:high-affinity nickel-transport protein [Rhizobiales bacterium GAS113]|nr:high-affinity nickel-transport protein [Rhizobiales bacterium GAS113]
MTIVSSIFNDRADGLQAKVTGIYGLLVAGNVATWTWALIAFRDTPILLSTAFLAYSFGLRHAFDADHIAAIDNVTRKLMQEGKRPVTVGFFFSLGHSTVVVGLAVLIALTTTVLADRYFAFKDIGGVIGTSVSALFLFIIAAANILVLIQVYKAFQSVKCGGRLVEEDLGRILAQRGFLGRIFRRLFRLIKRSWHMYPLGLLFGLGFDTATEVSLLGISASQASHGLSIWSILIFPALFTAGMALMDTTDGVVMLGVYGWAFVKPIRKLYYNLTLTFVSVAAALVIGAVEVLGLIGDKLRLVGPFWDAIGAVSDNLGTLGYSIVALFIVSWLISIPIYRARGYDRLGVQGESGAATVTEAR